LLNPVDCYAYSARGQNGQAEKLGNFLPQKPSPNSRPTLGIPPLLCCPGALFMGLHATNELAHVLDALLLHELAEPGDNM